MEGYQPSGFSYQVRTKSGSVRRELRQHEELAQFEASDDGAAARDAYLALNEQVAEVKRMLYRFMQSLNSTS